MPRGEGENLFLQEEVFPFPPDPLSLFQKKLILWGLADLFPAGTSAWQMLSLFQKKLIFGAWMFVPGRDCGLAAGVPGWLCSEYFERRRILMEKKKYGWTEKGIVGLIFTPMGALFTLLGFFLWYFGVGKDPGDPRLFLFVFGGIGLPFLLTGLGLLWADIARRRADRAAYESGYSVMATIAGVHIARNMSNGVTNPRAVECHWTDPDTGEMHVWFSRYLSFTPPDELIGMQVPVYIDRMGGKGAFVDIDAVLPKVVVHKR